MIETGEFDFENRIVAPQIIKEDDSETDYSLRPKTLSEYIGQDKVKENMTFPNTSARTRSRRTCPYTSKPQKSVAGLWITSCSTALPASERPPFRR